MTTNPNDFRRRDPGAGSEHYIDAAIRTASPARLRLMLIERAIEVCGTVARVWSAGENPGSNEHSLRLLDLLNELLSGITGGTTPAETELCQKVADLYVFLAKHLVAAEENSDSMSVLEIQVVLQAEAETWRAVCAQEMPQQQAATVHGTASSSGLNFSV